MSHEARFKELKLELPSGPRALGVYKFVLVLDGLAYVSGHGPVGVDGTAICGRLGETLQKEAGYEAARRTGLNMLGTLRQHFGSLDAIRRLGEDDRLRQRDARLQRSPGRDQRLQRADARRLRAGGRPRGPQRDGRGIVAGRLGG